MKWCMHDMLPAYPVKVVCVYLVFYQLNRWSECLPNMLPAFVSEVGVCQVHNQLMPEKWVYTWSATSPASEVSVCLLYYQLMPVKWMYAWHTTSWCQCTVCIPGMLPAYASEVSVCLVPTCLYQWSEYMPRPQPAYFSEVRACLVRYKDIPVQRMYAWCATC